jgi:hypothetical protein
MRMNANPAERCAQRGISVVQWSFRSAIAVYALIDCWMCRFSMNPDGISYLDMGDLYWKGNWRIALNSYWSPLYGWLTGFLLRMTKPAMRWEFPEVHLLNFAILLAALFGFEFFWRELLASRDIETWELASLEYAWILGYLLFACVLLVDETLALVTPDLLVAAIVFITSGMILRFTRGSMVAASTFLLGVLLGIGYLAKAAMLPFAVISIITMLVIAWKQHLRKSLVAAATLGFLTVALPFSTLLSLNMHRPTFGDSARINQGWLVNGVLPKFRHWQGDRSMPAQHPTRRLFISPDVYEFATPVEGTYPVWYDPGYWYAGLDSSVHPAREILTFVRETNVIVSHIFRLQKALVIVVLMMILLSDGIGSWWRRLMRLWPILIPSTLVILMYAIVHWEERYTWGVVVVLFGAAMVSTVFSDEGQRTRAFRTAALILALLTISWIPESIIRHNARSVEEQQQVLVAEQLHAMGIEPGDHVALIGDGIHAYWARLAKVRIVAEVPHSLDSQASDSAAVFWNSSPERKQAVLDVLRSTGAKAVVTDTPPSTVPPGWVSMGNSERFVYFFR